MPYEVSYIFHPLTAKARLLIRSLEAFMNAPRVSLLPLCKALGMHGTMWFAGASGTVSLDLQGPLSRLGGEGAPSRNVPVCSFSTQR